LDGLVFLRDSSPHNFHLLLLGEGHDRDRLQARIEALGLREHVTLVGAVPPGEVAHYCHLAELFVFASRSETQGMVVLEAMAAGLPVVVIRSSGIEDIVAHGVNGYKTGPDPQAWSQRIDDILSDDALKARMSGQASGCAAEHRIEKFATAVLRVYRYVIEARRKKRAG
ncbi:MAG: glycosyltransferase, partial [Pseudomonadota bacterium]